MHCSCRIFLLARGGDAKKQALLEREVEEYHDIIQGDFHDSFRNLTIKDIMFMRWMITYCPQVKFIFKVSNFLRLAWFLNAILKAGFRYKRGKEHSLFLLLMFPRLKLKRKQSKAKKSVKQTKNNLFHARSGNGP